jgi:poly(3-hydroxybutyrate) depolymerase
MWGDAADGMQVGLVRIQNGGHAEPSALKRYPGFINRLVGRRTATSKSPRRPGNFSATSAPAAAPDYDA